MNEITTEPFSNGVLEDCIDAFRRARGDLLKGAALLFKIRETNAWEPHFASFTAFVESGCQMNKSQASRLLTVYEHYVVENKMGVELLNGINPEKLYLARKSAPTVEDQVAKAKTLSVAELREENTEIDLHACEPILVCKHCWKRLDYEES